MLMNEPDCICCGDTGFIDVGAERHVTCMCVLVKEQPNCIHCGIAFEAMEGDIEDCTCCGKLICSSCLPEHLKK